MRLHENPLLFKEAIVSAAQIGSTRLRSNQLGYISHNEQARNRFNPSRHIEIN